MIKLKICYLFIKRLDFKILIFELIADPKICHDYYEKIIKSWIIIIWI